MAPTRGRDSVHDRTKGGGLASGVAPPKGQTRSTSPKPAYELEGTMDPIPLPLTLAPTPSVRELLLYILARLERASPTSVILDASATPVPVGPSIASPV